MNDLGVHLGLLALISLATVTLGAPFNHLGDVEALKDPPNLNSVFPTGCASCALTMFAISPPG